MVMEGWTGRLRAGACWALAGLRATAAALLAAASVASADPLAWAPPRLVDWQQPFATGVNLNDIACPTTQLCLAVSESGNVFTSTTPADPASWTLSSTQAAINGRPARPATSAWQARAPEC